MVAERLGWRYLDTGAMYRAVTWLALDLAVDPADAKALVALARSADLALSTDPSTPAVTVNGVDVTEAIRGPEVTATVSTVSAVPGVRAEMVRRQRELIGPGSVVVEGRDIGTTVVPDAVVKIFLTASGHERALRRAREHHGRDVDDVTDTRTQLERRDASDSGRAASPLQRAGDAHEIDSTGLGIDEVVAAVLALVPAGLTR
jgi:cytidylate kinase